jgi:hypothetical protein
MDETETPTDTKAQKDSPKEETSIAPKDMPPWKMELGKLLWGLVTAGSVSGGGVMAVISGSELPKIALGAAAGGLFTGMGALGVAYSKPLARRAEKGFGAAGDKTVEALDRTAEQLWARATKQEEKYCLAQAEVCEGSSGGSRCWLGADLARQRCCGMWPIPWGEGSMGGMG